MNQLIKNRISKSDFIKLNEKDLIFITNPGRMGDEDGTTFIIKQKNELTIYRVDGWMYPNRGDNTTISLDDVSKQFPKWREAWKQGEENSSKEKYKYLYMGYGNGLSIDNSMYKEYESYLNELVEEYLKKNNTEERETLKYIARYKSWEQAFINMAEDKGYILK